LSGIFNTYVQGGQIMWFTVFQAIVIIMSFIALFSFIFFKKYRFIKISKILLFISLISTSIAYHIHITNRTNLLNGYLIWSQHPSKDVIIGGNVQTLIFPNFEIWFVLIIAMLLIIVNIIEISNKKI
jgi:hypothetical protein